MFQRGACGYPLPVPIQYQIISAKLCFFYEGTVNFGKVFLPAAHSGAFMLSTMLMRRTCRRMTKHTIRVNSMVSATASR